MSSCAAMSSGRKDGGPTRDPLVFILPSAEAPGWFHDPKFVFNSWIYPEFVSSFPFTSSPFVHSINSRGRGFVKVIKTSSEMRGRGDGHSLMAATFNDSLVVWSVSRRFGKTSRKRLGVSAGAIYVRVRIWGEGRKGRRAVKKLNGH